MRPAPAKPNPTRAQRRLAARYGRWAVVTGASDGIGREMAREAARAGLNVVLVARRKLRLVELANELGVETRVIDGDLGDPAFVVRVVEDTRDLDVGLFAACAGFGTSGPLTDTVLDHELDMIDVNCRSVLALTKTFAARFAARGRGGIVLMSSLVAFQGVPQAANYAATKAYVQTLAEGLRRELRPRGVDVIAAAPGPVASGFAARADMQMGMAARPEVVARGTLAALGRRTTVRPGLLAQVLVGSLAMLPRGMRVLVLQAVMGGMTRHQRAVAGQPRHA